MRGLEARELRARDTLSVVAIEEVKWVERAGSGKKVVLVSGLSMDLVLPLRFTPNAQYTRFAQSLPGDRTLLSRYARNL